MAGRATHSVCSTTWTLWRLFMWYDSVCLLFTRYIFNINAIEMLGKTFSRRHFETFILFFTENRLWPFMQRRQFAWKVKAYVHWNIGKKCQFVVCWICPETDKSYKKVRIRFQFINYLTSELNKRKLPLFHVLKMKTKINSSSATHESFAEYIGKPGPMIQLHGIGKLIWYITICIEFWQKRP